MAKVMTRYERVKYMAVLTRQLQKENNGDLTDVDIKNKVYDILKNPELMKGYMILRHNNFNDEADNPEFKTLINISDLYVQADL